ncbi:hypothetical protein [Alloalcanivorax venustensis]|uniref:hypothetical protein n=1 Tax=Alloalcanivorax venustensis TaxID=172371 RepID=UPI001891354B|nr:hypothetical protein [Alloalcanivorax venustensis]
MDPDDSKLQSNRVDSAVSIAKGVLGTIPFAGSAFSELIGQVIPNQRLDRIAAFLNELDKRLMKIEVEMLHQNQYALDLFEDSMYQSVKILSEDRNKYLAIFLKKSIDVDSASYSTRKQLLNILQDVTDDDLDVLISISRYWYQPTARKNLLRSLTVGQYDSLSDDERNEYEHARVSFGLHIATLSRLNLIHVKYKETDPEGHNAHIDRDTGLPEVEDCSLTNIGKLLLLNIGASEL